MDENASADARHTSSAPRDLDLLKITDDPKEAVRIILDYERHVGAPANLPKAFA